MIGIKRIFCPTDLSKNSSDQALRYALGLASAYDAQLILCYVSNDPRDAQAMPLQPALTLPATKQGPRLIRGRTEEIFERVLLHFLSPHALSLVDWRALNTEGEDVAEAISRSATDCGADLIVMRSRRRPHRATILGSTTESVCRTAPCPVLVTHADERDWVQPLSHRIDLQRVLVAYDFSHYSEIALKYGLSLAQEYQAELHLIHVLPTQRPTGPEIAAYPTKSEIASVNATRGLQKATPSEAHLWCRIKHVVIEGSPHREILNYAESNQIDLIAMGAHGASIAKGARFGSNVDRVLRQAPSPVLVARPLKVRSEV